MFLFFSKNGAFPSEDDQPTLSRQVEEIWIIRMIDVMLHSDLILDNCGRYRLDPKTVLFIRRLTAVSWSLIGGAYGDLVLY